MPAWLEAPERKGEGNHPSGQIPRPSIGHSKLGDLEDPTYTEGIDPALFPAALFCWGYVEVLSGPGWPSSEPANARPMVRPPPRSLRSTCRSPESASSAAVQWGSTPPLIGVRWKAAGGRLRSCLRGSNLGRSRARTRLCATDLGQGCLLSQFGFGVNADNKTPLFRNEVVAALADAVLVVEAPHASGSLHTANHALEQGKPVFVCPGPITNPSFNGSHELIRAGATLVYHPDQILRDMGWEGSLIRPQGAHSELRSSILSELSAGPLTTDALAAGLDLDPWTSAKSFSDMEMERLIMRHGAGYSVV